MKYGDPIFTVRLPLWLIDKIRQHAKESGITMSELVRQILTDDEERRLSND